MSSSVSMLASKSTFSSNTLWRLCCLFWWITYLICYPLDPPVTLSWIVAPSISRAFDCARSTNGPAFRCYPVAATCLHVVPSTLFLGTLPTVASIIDKPTDSRPAACDARVVRVNTESATQTDCNKPQSGWVRTSRLLHRRDRRSNCQFSRPMLSCNPVAATCLHVVPSTLFLGTLPTAASITDKSIDSRPAVLGTRILDGTGDDCVTVEDESPDAPAFKSL